MELYQRENCWETKRPTVHPYVCPFQHHDNVYCHPQAMYPTYKFTKKKKQKNKKGPVD